MKRFRLLALAMAMVMAFAFAANAEPLTCNKKIESFDFVVDYSGSMMMRDAQIKKDKVLVARDLITRMNSLIPEQEFQGGLHTIAPTGTLIEQGPWNRAAMAAAAKKLNSNHQVFGRMTNMGTGLKTYEPFLSSMKRNAAVVLFTDGDNNTGLDLVATAQSIYATQRDLVIHIVSFADTKNGKANIEQIAKMNPDAVVVNAADIYGNDEALRSFVTKVWCGDEDVIVLRGVNFAFDSYALNNKAKAILNEAAGMIKSKPNTTVVLNGWTDSIGSDAYNKRLSQNRANSVKSYLAKQGIPASRMKAKGNGKSFKYDNKKEEGRYMNRRVEIGFE